MDFAPARLGRMELAAYLVVVGADDGEAPRFLHRQPSVDREHTPFPAAASAFALDPTTQPPASNQLRQHTAVLTLADGSRLYAASLELRSQRAGRRRALLLLSRRPLYMQSLLMLQALHTSLLRREPAKAARAARALLHLPLPLPGVEMRMRLADTPIRLSAAPLGAPPILGVSLSAFIELVGVDVAIGAVEALVSELRLAIVCQDARTLGASAEALLALFHPFEWPHTYIPLLPMTWREYCEAPCPFLIGLVTADGDDVRSLLPADVCVLDIDAATLTVPVDESAEPFPPSDAARLRQELHEWRTSVGAADSDCPAEEAVHAEANAGAQRAWMRHWRRLLDGYASHLVDGGAEIDGGRMLESVTTERLPFTRQLMASAAFHRYLERVAADEAIDELSKEQSDDAPPLATLELPDDLGLAQPPTVQPTAESGPGVDGEIDDLALGRLLEWPAVDDAAATGTSAAMLLAAEAAVEASPRSVPLQLTYARELVRVGRPMEALDVLEALGALLGSLAAPRGSTAGDQLTLRSLVRSCLAAIDPRKLAELATLREATVISPPHRARRESAPSQATPPAATAPAATEPTDVTDRFAQTLHKAATAAAAHRAALAPHTPPQLPQHTRSHSAGRSSLSPQQRPPLRAVWARAYLDEQSRARSDELTECMDDAERATATRTTAGGGDSDDESDRGAIEREVEGFMAPPTPLLGRLDGASSSAPPAGWGLAIPWPWDGEGSDASVRRQHVAVEPVQLFSQLQHRRDADGVGGGGDLQPASEMEAEISCERDISWDDFSTFGGELLQVMGAPELSRLWDCFLTCQPPATIASAAVIPRRLSFAVFEAWHTALRTTLHPTPSWRRRLGLEARELLLKRMRRPSVRSEALGVPGYLALTSERLLLGSVRFQTAASLPAVRSVRAFEGLLGEAMLRIMIDGRGSAPLLLRFGRGGAARTRRDTWFCCIELLRRAYAHAYALASDVPIAQAAHCVACAAALPSEADGSPLLQLLPAQPPRSGAPSGACAASEVDSAQWRLVRLSGDIGSAPALRIGCIASVGSAFAIATLGGEIILSRLCVSSTPLRAGAAPAAPPPSPAAHAIADSEEEDDASASPLALRSLLPDAQLPAPILPPLHVTSAAASAKSAKAERRHALPPAPPTLYASDVTAASQLVSCELARVQLSEPPSALTFAAAVGSHARLLAQGSCVSVWSSRLRSSVELPKAEGHRTSGLAVASRGAAEGSLIAVASEHVTDNRAAREVRVFELRGARGDAPTQLRLHLLPAAIRAMAFCGDGYLCVAHDEEYVRISLADGSVRELFRFTPSFGAPYLRRLGPNELLLVQPPPRPGERLVGVFLDRKGQVARRSTAHWRRPPIACLARGRTLVSVLPNAIEITHPEQEPPAQSLPFPEPRGADDGGDHLLVASCNAVYVLLPPAPA